MGLGTPRDAGDVRLVKADDQEAGPAELLAVRRAKVMNIAAARSFVMNPGVVCRL